jgi:hypothetical protein
MQKMAGERQALLATAVNPIPNNRIPRKSQMNPNLMGTAG